MGAGLAGVCMLGWLVILCVYDIRERRLPNALTLPGAAVILGVATAAGRGMPALFGGVALFAIYLIVHLSAPAAMGAGDVKLAIGVGALTGWFGVDVWAVSALAAPLLTAAWAIVAVVRRAESTVPHGPSMCVSTVVACALAVL
jgi:leader peptidase (prepilin peptidase)/N-methyltransferase